MQPKLNTFYIQAARGVAVLLVMLFHASQTGQRYLNYNYLDISGMGRSGAYTFFFVLTGYLMFTLYYRRFGDQQSAWPFLLKRMCRIFPLYWLVTAAVLPMYFLMPSFGYGYERQLPVIIKSLLLWPQANAPILPVAWSLSYIVFFYIMFSLSFLSRGKWAASVYSSWLTIIVLNAFGIVHAKDGVVEQFLFNEAHAGFFVGMLVAYIARRKPFRGHGAWWIAGSGLLYAALWAAREQFPALPHADLLHTAGSALLLIGVISLKGGASRWLKPLEACGNASYSILLLSLPALSVTFKLARAVKLDQLTGPFVSVTLCALAALALCLLFYRWIELPINRRIRNAIQSKTSRRQASYPAPAAPAG